MSNAQFANFVAGTLTSALPASGTAMLAALVAGANAFPNVSAPSYYYLTLIDNASFQAGVSPPAQREIVKVTNYAGVIFTITRGVDGTSAQNWAVGDRVELRLTAQGLVDATATLGTAVLAGGTVVVNNALVTANSNIQLCCNVPGGTPGFLRVSARTPGVSFTILSSSGTDTSTVGWQFFG